MMLSLSTIHLLLMQHKSFTRSQRSSVFEEINQLRRFCMKLRFLIGGRTSLEGWPDKSGNPYWNPVRKAGHVRCLKPDSPVCQTGYSGFGWTDHWSGIQTLENFLLKSQHTLLDGRKVLPIYAPLDLIRRFNLRQGYSRDLIQDYENYGLERHLFTNG